MFYSGHFGNHEAFRAALYKHGIKVGGMVRRMANPYFDVQYKRMLDINGRGGPVFEADKHGTLAMVKSLKTGTALVLLLDLALSYGMPVTFMGRSVYCSVTAASFALKTKALFVPYFSMRNSDGESFSVEIGPPIEHSDAETMTREATKSIENRVYADPGNWFWIHRRWKYATTFGLKSRRAPACCAVNSAIRRRQFHHCFDVVPKQHTALAPILQFQRWLGQGRPSGPSFAIR